VRVPGNHDARNVGYLHFEDTFGARDSRARLELDGLEVALVAVDSSKPDLDEGEIGREHYGWIEEGFAGAADLRVFVCHHHLMPIPGTGRERNQVLDAGDVRLVSGLDVASGPVSAEMTPRHGAKRFRRFLNLIETSVPAHLDTRVVLESSSTHKPPSIQRWLLTATRWPIPITLRGLAFLSQDVSGKSLSSSPKGARTPISPANWHRYRDCEDAAASHVPQAGGQHARTGGRRGARTRPDLTRPRQVSRLQRARNVRV
jgi:hypothetical protein